MSKDNLSSPLDPEAKLSIFAAAIAGRLLPSNLAICSRRANSFSCAAAAWAMASALHFKCSLYVLIDSRARQESQSSLDRNLFLICYSDDSYLEKKDHRPYMSLTKGEPMARIDQTDDWQDRHAPTISTFESLAIDAYGHLPEEFRALTTNLTIEIEDFPDDDVFEDMALETPFDLLGLFEGRGISERFTVETGELPNRIRLYRRPILDYWAENDETLGDIITHVLIHEIGHHFGLSDEDMERIEASAENATQR